MNDNTVKTNDNNGNTIDVYLNDIYRYADDYIIDNIPDDDIKNNNISSISFMGMILFIHDNITKPSNDDIDLLDSIFNIYIRLCTKYSQLPTLECFSMLVGIDNGTFSDWGSGKYRLGSPHGQTVKKWKNICKQFLVNNLSNSKGGDINKIFIAKAAYGMVETAPVQMINEHQYNRSAEQIASDYNNVKEIDSKEVKPEF